MSTTEQPATTMPPASVALLRRLDEWAARMQATYPAHAEAIRRRAQQQAEEARNGND